MHGGVLVLNASYEVMESTTWQDAVRMVVTGEADIHEADPERTVRSPSITVPFPRVVVRRRYVYVKFTDRGLLDVGGFASKKGVLERDKYTCVYCGTAGANTVDHVQPQSRGGKNSWENLAACCRACNQLKGDRTPEEAGMRLRWNPWRPDKTGYTQRRVWAGLQPAMA